MSSTHAFLGHFPIALFVFGLACDLALILRFRLDWLDRTALLSLACATLLSLPTAVSGKLTADALAPVLGERELAAVGLHGDWAFVTVVLFFIALAVRFESFWRERRLDAPRASKARLVALAISILAAASLVETASRGGELVLRHGLGVESSR